MDNQVLEVIKKRSSARAYSDEELRRNRLRRSSKLGFRDLQV